MSGPDEYAEMIEELRVVKQQNEHYRIQLGAAREMNAALASKLGKMEQQRNHARWKYGRGKRRWREQRNFFEGQIAQLRTLYWNTEDFKRQKAYEHLSVPAETPASIGTLDRK